MNYLLLLHLNLSGCSPGKHPFQWCPPRACPYLRSPGPLWSLIPYLSCHHKSLSSQQPLRSRLSFQRGLDQPRLSPPSCSHPHKSHRGCWLVPGSGTVLPRLLSVLALRFVTDWAGFAPGFYSRFLLRS